MRNLFAAVAPRIAILVALTIAVALLFFRSPPPPRALPCEHRRCADCWIADWRNGYDAARSQAAALATLPRVGCFPRSKEEAVADLRDAILSMEPVR